MELPVFLGIDDGVPGSWRQSDLSRLIVSIESDVERGFESEGDEARVTVKMRLERSGSVPIDVMISEEAREAKVGMFLAKGDERGDKVEDFFVFL